MKRGDIVTVAAPGDYGKPRPAVIIQSDWLNATDSVLVCLMTATLRPAPLYRLDIPAGTATGLRHPSQIQVEKMMAIRRDKCGPVIGHLDESTLASLGRMAALMIGVAD